MPEWIKILISAFAGFLAGQIAEILKNNISVLRMQRAIAMDCLAVSITINAAREGLVPEEKAWQGVRLQAFEYYWEKSRELFFRSIPLHTLAVQCQRIQSIKASVNVGTISSQQGQDQILETLEAIWAEKPKGGFLRRLFLRLVC